MTPDDEIELQAAHLEQLLPSLARRLFTVEPDHPLADLPVAQLRVCSLLLQRGARTMSQVGDELSISLSAVTQLADRLERAGLVARVAERSPGGDRRTKRLCLTPRGETLMISRRALRLARTEAALRHLPAASRRAVLDALETLLEAATGALLGGASDGEPLAEPAAAASKDL